MAAAVTDRPRAVHVEHCMGTVFTIDIRDPGDWTAAIGESMDWLHHVDSVFSTYQPDSDISRIRRGELRPVDADPDVRTVLDLCARAQSVTGGYFSAMTGRTIDPTGLVKGWAIERASHVLREHGSTNHSVNGGGDIQFAGHAAPNQPWRVGISDPRHRYALSAVVAGENFAVATSGTAERGKHIVDPFTGRPPSGYLSATVVGPSLALADVYATAAFVMGRHAARWIDGIDGYTARLIAENGSHHASTGWLSGPTPNRPRFHELVRRQGLEPRTR